MSVKVDIIDFNIVFTPTSTIEEQGIQSILSLIEGESTDPDTIRNRFIIDRGYTLEDD